MTKADERLCFSVVLGDLFPIIKTTWGAPKLGDFDMLSFPECRFAKGLSLSDQIPFLCLFVSVAFVRP